jgi:hypothetical protein
MEQGYSFGSYIKIGCEGYGYTGDLYVLVGSCHVCNITQSDSCTFFVKIKWSINKV